MAATTTPPSTTPALPASRTPAPQSPGPQRDWTEQATETVESLVLAVKEKTTILRTIARAIVYGLVVAVVGTTALVMLMIGAIRVADVWLLGWAGRVHGQHRLWIAYVVVGIILTLFGLICWSRRTAKETA